jgi:hypothetical protein
MDVSLDEECECDLLWKDLEFGGVDICLKA